MSRHQKGIKPVSWHKVIFSQHEVLISTSFMSVKANRKSFRHLLEVAAAHSDCKQRRWIFHARSDFWGEKLHGGSLRRFTSTWVVDLCALAMLASMTGFILHCFQHRECSGAVTTCGWSWRKNHASMVSLNLNAGDERLKNARSNWTAPQQLSNRTSLEIVTDRYSP